jgi:hypothetical protein
MKKALIIAGIVLLIPLAWYGFVFSAGIYRILFSPYLDREISGPGFISTQWLDIVPKQPLTADRQIQEIIINFAERGAPEVGSRGIRMTDGTVVIPEVELVDERGGIFTLRAVAFGADSMGFSADRDLPKDRTYRSVKIKATKPIELSNIHWKCWNQWDVS